MTGAVVITWGQGVPGREAKALQVFAEALEHATTLAKRGRIHGHKEYVSVTGDRGKVAGVQILDGEMDELQSVLTDEQFRRITLKAETVVQSFSIQLLSGGSDEAVGHAIETRSSVMEELGIA